MIRLLAVWFSMLVMTGSALADPVVLTARDGVKVHGQFWRSTVEKAPPLILAFHQAGSSHEEYTPLAPRLNQAGFSVLAIDQRSGGGEFGGTNKTVAALGRTASYDAAYADLEAALAWARGHSAGAPILVWGSSYSAALVFLLVAKHPNEVAGLLAFSPGEYLDSSNAVKTAARAVRIPVFINQSDEVDEIQQSREIIQATASRDKTMFVPKRGVHGSATLRADRNAAGAEENWRPVLNFLSRVKGAK